MEAKKCIKCGDPIPDGNKRKKFCCESCKYWYNSIKKDNEKHLPPFKKRNKNFFSMVTGYKQSISARGQGRRRGGEVKGAMAANVNYTVEQWAELNAENLKRHFTSISFWQPSGITLGDQTRIRKDNIEKETGFKIDY